MQLKKRRMTKSQKSHYNQSKIWNEVNGIETFESKGLRTAKSQYPYNVKRVLSSKDSKVIEVAKPTKKVSSASAWDAYVATQAK